MEKLVSDQEFSRNFSGDVDPLQNGVDIMNYDSDAFDQLTETDFERLLGFFPDLTNL